MAKKNSPPTLSAYRSTNSSEIFEFEISLHQTSEQEIDQVKRILGLISLADLIILFENLDLKANVREAKKSNITKVIQNSLNFSPEIFPILSKGILLSCSGAKKQINEKYIFSFRDTTIEGIIDGGHNSFAIGQYILNNSLSKQGKPFNSKSKNWADFKKLFKINLEEVKKFAESELGMRMFATLVPIEILVPKNNLLSDRETTKFSQIIKKVQTARNNNAQVKLTSLMNNDLKFEELKKGLPPELNELVEWRSNEGNRINPDHIVAFSCIVFNVLLKDLKLKSQSIVDANNKPIEPLNPPTIYSQKQTCVKFFNKLHAAVEESDDIELQLKIKSAYKLIGKFPELFDLIYSNFSREFDLQGTKKFKTIQYVQRQNRKKRVIKTTPYYEKPVGISFPQAYVYPIIYSLNKLIVVDKEMKWISDPVNFINENLAAIINKYHERYMRELRYEPQKIGKSREVYLALEDLVELLISKINF